MTRHWAKKLLGLGALAIAAASLACSTAAPPAPKAAEKVKDAAYLPSPLDGYPRSIAASEAEALRAIHGKLIQGGSPQDARSGAGALLETNPALEPAELVVAQADYLTMSYAAAAEKAGALAERYPDYTAAQLLAGRSAEKLERIKEAYQAFRRIAGRDGLARRRAGELEPRAVEITGNRIEDLLDRGRLEDAEAEVAVLEEWAAGEPRTLELVARYAEAAGDPARELEAVRGLLEGGSSVELLRRRARLEMVAGDAGVGLRILESLVAAAPEDAELARDLERAKFRWRLGLLPAEVLDLLRVPYLNRGQHAKLLFWLFPDVRYGRPSEGRIATDILDHPAQTEIARVVNLGVMKVDSTLHLFRPERGLERQEAVRSVLLILAERRPAPACFGAENPSASMSVERLCTLAARCGLLAEAGDCLPEAPASGPFVEGIGFAALDLLGNE